MPGISGYQSHCVEVGRKGTIYQGRGPKFTELVVFQEAQIVPKYLVYARKAKRGKTKPTDDKSKKATRKSKTDAKKKIEEKSSSQESDDDEFSDDDDDMLAQRQMWATPSVHSLHPRSD